MITTTTYVELHTLEIGARFHFLAFPDQVATLVEKGTGRAMIRYDRPRGRARTFEADVYRRTEAGIQKERKTVTLPAKTQELEPCALGAQVVPLDAA